MLRSLISERLSLLSESSSSTLSSMTPSSSYVVRPPFLESMFAIFFIFSSVEEPSAESLPSSESGSDTESSSSWIASLKSCSSDVSCVGSVAFFDLLLFLSESTLLSKSSG